MEIPVVLRFDPNIRFECRRCGSCCSTSVEGVIPLQLYPQEVSILRRLGYGRFIRYLDGVHYLSSKEGHCVFLTGERLCRLRVEHSWAPVNCRLFPITVKVINGSYVLSLNWNYVSTVGCRGFGEGPTIAEHFGEVEKLLTEVAGYLKG